MRSLPATLILLVLGGAWRAPAASSGERAPDETGVHRAHRAFVGAIHSNDVESDTGWGLAVYHRDAGGVWRVARDAWGFDYPPR